MPKFVEVRLILTGPYTGKTVTLNGHFFDQGVCVVQGEPESLRHLFTYMARCYQAYPQGSIELEEARAAWEAYCAKENGHGVSDIETDEEQPDPPSEDASNLQPVGEGPATEDAQVSGTDDAGAPGQTEPDASGNGLPDPRPDDGTQAQGQDAAQTLTKLAKAVMSLDPDNDEHWTGAGLPAMAAVEAAYGSTDITRKQVEAELPNWNREMAQANKPAVD